MKPSEHFANPTPGHTDTPQPQPPVLHSQPQPVAADSAFVEVYAEYFPKLYNYGLQLVPSPQLVKDCIQEIFVSLYTNKQAHVRSVKPYLYASLRRAVLKAAKKEDRFLDLETAAAANFGISFSPETIMIRQQMAEQDKEQLEKALNQLGPRQREALLLYYYEGLNYQEIAEVMGLGLVKSARTFVYRALASLKKSWP